jgi:acylphosphatase
VIRRRVIVSGQVQGVFFRDTIERTAFARKVAGHITNLADGRVEAVFEGKSSDVDVLIELCRNGPERAIVENVEVIGEDPEGLEGFRVT